MIRAEFREVLENQQQVLVILWAFFFFGIFVYLWIAEFLVARLGPPSGSAASELGRIVIWILSFIELATLVWWKKRSLTTEAILGGVSQHKLLQALRGHSSPVEERAAAVVSSYITSKVVAFAIIEAIAVFGLVVNIVGRHTVDQYLLSLASGALLVVEFPFKPRLQELLSAVEKESP